MLLHNAAHRVEGTMSQISRWLGMVAVVMLMAMMLLTVGDVFMRAAFSHPIRASAEYTGYMMIFTAFVGMGWASLTGTHIKVDLIVGRLPIRAQGVLDIINALVVMGVCFLLTWQTCAEALVSREMGAGSLVTGLPYYPFMLVITFGTGWMFLAMIIVLVRSVNKGVKG